MEVQAARQVAPIERDQLISSCLELVNQCGDFLSKRIANPERDVPVSWQWVVELRRRSELKLS